jgi:hypothetical protein
MRRLIVAAIVAMSMALAPAALGHPSENRADQSTFGGPHCHTNLISGKPAFPSHKAHDVTGLSDGIFAALVPCPE